MKKVTDVNIVNNTPLPRPVDLLGEIPRKDSQADFVADSRAEIHNIIFGNDKRFLLVIGPCSVHDIKSGEEYARKIAKLSERVKDRMLLVMRVYFEKPRTTVGWKGLIMDPKLDGTSEIAAGLRIARRFLGSVLDLGVPTATELLDPITPQYIADLVCWSAIGARTTESQTHRQMASGLSMPLGFKNSTSGAIKPAINAIKAATSPQTFLGVDELGQASCVTTGGNPNCHIILRGGDDGPNYSLEHIREAEDLLRANGLIPAIMVDTSHANCGKDHEMQPQVFRKVLRHLLDGHDSVIGAMIESNLLAGKQSFPRPATDLTYGLSITDPCIGWETTEELILEAHEQLGERMAAKP